MKKLLITAFIFGSILVDGSVDAQMPVLNGVEGMGNLSNITFGLVWIFYGSNVVFWALSAYRWHAEKKIH